MKPSSTPRTRRRLASRDPATPQTDPRKESSFFGALPASTFFPPAGALQRSPEAPGKEEKETIARAPEEKDETIARAPEEKKEDSVQRAAEDPKEEKLAKVPEERENERVSRIPEEKKEETISRKAEAPAAGERTTDYVKTIHGRGDPLPKAEQEWFGERMGRDFGNVRVHTGPEAEASARDAGAKAYAWGSHLVFDEGRYRPDSAEGRHLLAHELTHVVQQGGARPRAPSGDHVQSGRNPSAGSGETARTGAVLREVAAPTASTAPAPTDPALARNRLSVALGQMTTPTVVGETLSGTLEPVLRDLAANAEWRDATGTSTGGAEVAVGVPGPGHRTVRLRLVLDDDPNPPLTGRFDSTGPDAASIRVYLRDNPNADTLATTLYHESLHLMGWLARAVPGGDLVAQTGATGGRRATLEGIDPSRHPRHLADVRRRVADLAASVNAIRPASDRVDASGIDRLSSSLLEEYLVRIETEVFRLMRDSDAASRAPVTSVRFGTSADLLFPRADLDTYLFEVGSVFRAADRAALGGYDRARIDELHAYFRDRVLHFVGLRYSEVVHGPGFP